MVSERIKTMIKKIFTTAQIVFFTGFLALLISIIYGVAAYDILAEGSVMLAVYWGRFTFIDIYVVFIIFFLWTTYRDHSVPKSILWFLLIMLGGSMSICLYLFLAFRGADNDMKKLLTGTRKAD